MMRYLRWITAFLWCTAFLQGSSFAEDTAVSQDAKTTQAASAKSEDPQQQQQQQEDDLGPVVLTSRNFGRNVGDGNVWLVEIYAPWCGHCISFEGIYKEIADFYHHASSAEEKKIRVGKINGDAEQALVSRFGAKSYPSFYVVDGFSVYKFDKTRSKSALMNYVEGGYKKTNPIPWYTSPNGPLGIAQGIILRAGYTLADTFYWLQDAFGLSAVFAGMVMFGTLFIGMFITLVTMAIIFTPKDKVD